MPTSSPDQIPAVLAALMDVRPAPVRVLDVGFGCGKYGFLAREYLTVWNHYLEPWGSVPLHLTGIEVHEQYVGAVARVIYDDIIIGDALQVLPGMDSFDACLLVDVLEHFTHPEGERLLALLAERVRQTVIGIPATFAPTLPVWGNEHEVHRCAWTPGEFGTYGAVQVYRHDDALVVRVDHTQRFLGGT